jgi:multidrug efflux pump subunit AcrA (membrane-fusion protein)
VKVPEPAPVAIAAPPPAPVPDATALEQEARALLAQAETDIQRARAKRALWLKAWEALVLARQAAESKDNAATVRHARRASELAQLGLEQLAFPAVN